MRHLLRMIGKDLRRWSRDPVQLLLWAAIPLAIAIIMKLAFGGDGPSVQVRLAIADQDQTLVTQLLRGSFSQGQLADLYETTVVDSAEAWQLASKGKVSAALFIPKGFTDAYLDGRVARLQLVRNPAEQILPGIAVQTLQILADGGSALRAVFGTPIDEIRGMATRKAAPSDSTVLGISRTVQGTLDRVGGTLLPPVLSLMDGSSFEAAAAGDSAGGTNVSSTEGTNGSATEDKEDSIDYFALFFPGIVLMSLLFIGQALASDLWEEERLGTYRRSLVSAEGLRGWVLAKTIAGTVVFLLVFEALFIVGKYLLRIDLGSIHLASGYLALSGFAFLAGFEWITVLAGTERSASLFTSLFVMPLVLLGGSLIPLESMPPFLRAIGEHTPNGMVLGVAKGILFGSASASSVVTSLAICLGLGALFVALTAGQARRRFLGE